MTKCDDCGKAAMLYHNEPTGQALCESCDVAADKWASFQRKLERRRKLKRAAIYTAIAYAMFWIGGWWSYNLTHECVRSHTELQGGSAYLDQDPTEAEVCDFSVDNGKRWSIYGPAQYWIPGI